jgi:hypothetical protein
MVAIASVPWIAAFAAEYEIDLRTLRANHTLTSFWAAGFPPVGAGASGTLHWLGHDALRLAADPLGLSFGVLVLVLFGVGIVRLAIAQPAAAMFVALVSAVACAAAIARVYPLDTRLALYLDVPAVLTICAAGGAVHTGARHAVGRALGWRVAGAGAMLGVSAAVAASAASSVQAAATAVQRPYVTVESRPLIQFIDSHLRPGEPVFVQGYDLQPAVYYHWTLGFRVTGGFSYRASAGCSSLPAIATMRSAVHDHGELWILFGYPPPVPGGWSTIGDTIRNNEAMLAGLGRIEEVRRAAGPGSAALLVDPAEASTIRRKSTATGCIVASDIPASALKE